MADGAVFPFLPLIYCNERRKPRPSDRLQGVAQSKISLTSIRRSSVTSTGRPQPDAAEKQVFFLPQISFSAQQWFVFSRPLTLECHGGFLETISCSLNVFIYLFIC